MLRTLTFETICMAEKMMSMPSIFYRYPRIFHKAELTRGKSGKDIKCIFDSEVKINKEIVQVDLSRQLSNTKFHNSAGFSSPANLQRSFQICREPTNSEIAEYHTSPRY